MQYKTVATLMFASALCGVGGTLYLSQAVAPDSQAFIDPVVLVGQIQELARLETAAVPLSTTVHGKRGSGWIGAAVGEELVFHGIGEARAGVDLGELGPEDLWVDAQGVVWLQLPEAQIFDVTLDEARSQVLVREQGWFGRASRSFETEARRTALAELEAQAEGLGLREAARDHAEVVVSDLMRTLGAPEVRFAAPEAEATLL